MSIQQCAAAVVQVIPADATVQTSAGQVSLREVFLCIGGPESNWNPQAAGDSVASLQAYAAAHPGVQVYYPPSWATCNGESAWGWLQINWSHYLYLKSVTGSQEPCQWSAWLYNPVNCARAAYVLYQSAGLSPWGADMAGPWLQYRGQAQAALASIQTSSPSAPDTGTTTRVTVTPGVVLGGAAAILVLGVVAIELGFVEVLSARMKRRRERGNTVGAVRTGPGDGTL